MSESSGGHFDCRSVQLEVLTNPILDKQGINCTDKPDQIQSCPLFAIDLDDSLDWRHGGKCAKDSRARHVCS